MEYLFPILIFLALALIAGALLTYLAFKFPGEQTETEQEIRAALPGMNCGMCGFSGCDGYAHAIAAEGAAINRCVPGGERTAQALSAITGAEASAVEEKKAFVRCGGTCGARGNQFDYRGVPSCAGASQYYSGQSTCAGGCLGFGDCAAVCPNGAIRVKDGCASVNPMLCAGCGLCVSACPKGLVTLLPAQQAYAARCHSHAPGGETRKSCKNGCIGCKKCERVCEHDAIHVKDNLAEIDAARCAACGKCAEVCPIGVITLRSGCPVVQK